MFSKLIAISTFAILAVATPAPNSSPSSGSCSTGPIQCCQSVQSANSSSIAPIRGALGIVVQDVNALVGLDCSAITGVGVGGGTW